MSNIKDDLLTIASSLETVMRDLSYLDPEEVEDEMPGILSQIDDSIMRLAGIANQLEG